MADFIQLTIKRRQTKDGFLDLVNKLRKKEGDLPLLESKIKQTVEHWLILDKGWSNPPSPTAQLKPLDILVAAHGRVCEIAGHAWLEFIKDASDEHIEVESARPLKHDDLHVAEFLPAEDYERLSEVFADSQGGSMPWRNVTGAQIAELFYPLLDESTENRQEAPDSDRDASGWAKGKLTYLPPANRKEFPRPLLKQWFEKPTGDRVDAYVTPVWEVEVRTEVLEAAAHPFYSFTPEHYRATDNCVTYAARILDDLVSGDWLEVIITTCKIGPVQCRQAAKGVDARDCKPYHIRRDGRVKCLEIYAKEADGARIKERLNKFA